MGFVINYLRLNPGSFFQDAVRFPGYTEKIAEGVAAGIISSSFWGRFFRMRGRFFQDAEVR